MVKNTLISVNLGPARLVVDNDRYTLSIVKKLTSTVSEIRDKHLSALDARVKRAEDETDETYNKRLAEVGDRNLLAEMAFDITKAIAENFGQTDKVTPESFESASWPSIKRFLFEVLSEGDINFAVAFQPRQTGQ